MDDHEKAQDEVSLPEDRVEDLAPDEEEAADVSGGYVKKHIGNVKYEDIK